MVARSINLEWAFQKKTPAEILTGQFLELANAVRSLPKVWPFDSSAKKDELLGQLLNLDNDSGWNVAALADLFKCHPPVRELSTWSHGLAFIRWILHRILPYPCFLVDTLHVAARLRVTHASFLQALERKEPLAATVDNAKYAAMLPTFYAPR